jgi:hypothetical protein
MCSSIKDDAPFHVAIAENWALETSVHLGSYFLDSGFHVVISLSR